MFGDINIKRDSAQRIGIAARRARRAGRRRSGHKISFGLKLPAFGASI
jgi:hypothetical protein